MHSVINKNDQNKKIHSWVHPGESNFFFCPPKQHLKRGRSVDMEVAPPWSHFASTFFSISVDYIVHPITLVFEINKYVKSNQCTRSSSVPRLDSIMVIFAKWATPGAWFELFDANGRTNGQTMANSIVPLPHFVRRGTKIITAFLWCPCPKLNKTCKQYKHDHIDTYLIMDISLRE